MCCPVPEGQNFTSMHVQLKTFWEGEAFFGLHIKGGEDLCLKHSRQGDQVLQSPKCDLHQHEGHECAYTRFCTVYR